MGLDHATIRLIPAVLWLAVIWIAESYVSGPKTGRWSHGFANLVLAMVNGFLLFLTIGLASVFVCEQFNHAWFGSASWLIAFVGLDLFGYIWHRANHRFTVLWRFHEIHHSDNRMDVTTSGRFHFGELGMGAVLRLPILCILGVSTHMLLIYETTLVAVSMLHHSSLCLGRLDAILRMIIVTPAMHSIHHSRDPVHFESNFASVLSIWDRIFGTFRTTSASIQHGLDGHDSRDIHCVRSMLASPFKSRDNIRK